MKAIRTTVAILFLTILSSYAATIPFELKNKSNSPIYISLSNGNKQILRRTEINRQDALRRSDININQPSIMFIYENKMQRDAQAHYYTLSSKGKTLYLKWENKKLQPQQGKNKMTTTGLSLNNNISSKDITKKQ